MRWEAERYIRQKSVPQFCMCRSPRNMRACAAIMWGLLPEERKAGFGRDIRLRWARSMKWASSECMIPHLKLKVEGYVSSKALVFNIES